MAETENNNKKEALAKVLDVSVEKIKYVKDSTFSIDGTEYSVLNDAELRQKIHSDWLEIIEDDGLTCFNEDEQNYILDNFVKDKDWDDLIACGKFYSSLAFIKSKYGRNWFTDICNKLDIDREKLAYYAEEARGDRAMLEKRGKAGEKLINGKRYYVYEY